MKVFHTPASTMHDPQSYFRRGATIPHPEQPLRYTVLLEAARHAGLQLECAPAAGLDPLRAVHDQDYLEFLANAWQRVDELPGPVDQILTGHFAKPQMHRRPTGLLGQIGYYTADTSTPIVGGTWRAVTASADAAIAAADAALVDGAAYALSRPPGHHAFADCAAGFCFLNNSAIAAQRLAEQTGERVAVIDVDVHHGNGTQAIFYTRPDVLTVSIHGHPGNFYPYYAGYEDETGDGEGEGANLNIPLSPGTGDLGWLAAIEAAIRRAATFGATSLVVALGLDAAADDPLSVLTVSGEGFWHAGRLLGEMRLPSAIVQEGGYLCAALPVNLGRFLDGFRSA